MENSSYIDKDKVESNQQDGSSEDKDIAEASRKKIYNRNRHKTWTEIAEAVSTRSSLQCLHRWTKVLKPGLKKGVWKPSEDRKLIRVIKAYQEKHGGTVRWSEIAHELPGRLGKQCRERWVQNLDPNIKKSSWTQEEEDLVMQKQAELGNQWSKIAQYIEGRTDNMIKNRWYGKLGREARARQGKAKRARTINGMSIGTPLPRLLPRPTAAAVTNSLPTTVTAASKRARTAATFTCTFPGCTRTFSKKIGVVHHMRQAHKNGNLDDRQSTGRRSTARRSTARRSTASLSLDDSSSVRLRRRSWYLQGHSHRSSLQNNGHKMPSASASTATATASVPSTSTPSYRTMDHRRIVVLELGSANLRIGFAGMKEPYVVPMCIAHRRKSTSCSSRRTKAKAKAKAGGETAKHANKQSVQMPQSNKQVEMEMGQKLAETRKSVQATKQLLQVLNILKKDGDGNTDKGDDGESCRKKIARERFGQVENAIGQGKASENEGGWIGQKNAVSVSVSEIIDNEKTKCDSESDVDLPPPYLVGQEALDATVLFPRSLPKTAKSSQQANRDGDDEQQERQACASSYELRYPVQEGYLLGTADSKYSLRHVIEDVQSIVLWALEHRLNITGMQNQPGESTKRGSEEEADEAARLSNKRKRKRKCPVSMTHKHAFLGKGYLSTFSAILIVPDLFDDEACNALMEMLLSPNGNFVSAGLGFKSATLVQSAMAVYYSTQIVTKLKQQARTGGNGNENCKQYNLQQPKMMRDTSEPGGWVHYVSGAVAAQKLGVNRSSLSKACRGIVKHAGGYQFKYAAKQSSGGASKAVYARKIGVNQDTSFAEQPSQRGTKKDRATVDMPMSIDVMNMDLDATVATGRDRKVPLGVLLGHPGSTGEMESSNTSMLTAASSSSAFLNGSSDTSSNSKKYDDQYLCVVDVGHQKTSIACVVRGTIIPGSVVHVPLGGQDVDRMLLWLLCQQPMIHFPGFTLPPRLHTQLPGICDEVSLQRRNEILVESSRRCRYLQEYQRRLRFHCIQQVKERHCRLKQARRCATVEWNATFSYDADENETAKKMAKATFKMNASDSLAIAPMVLLQPTMLKGTLELDRNERERRKTTSSYGPETDSAFFSSQVQKAAKMPPQWRRDMYRGSAAAATAMNAADDVCRGIDEFITDSLASMLSYDEENDNTFAGGGGIGLLQSLKQSQARRKAQSNIVLVGGGASFPGFSRLLQARLTQIQAARYGAMNCFPVVVRKRVGGVHPQHAAWRGAALLCSVPACMVCTELQ